MIGQEIGNYVLESKLGEGGMGEVYLARHKSLDTLAAVKVMAPAFSHDPKLHERFAREARTQAQLRHPHVAQVLDHVEQDDRWFLIIEYMENGTLEELLDDGRDRVSTEQALAWVRQALTGLDYAHSKGIIHRDVKPANVLINEHGEAAVTDFGIAMVVGAQRLTRTGTSIGTPEYMSPEQIQGRADLDHRTDVYSMGVVLYELLGGRVPFQSSSTFEIMEQQVKQPPPPLRELQPGIAPELEALVMKALAKDPGDRYATCGEFAEAIAAYERGEAPVAAGVTPIRGSRETVMETPGVVPPPPTSPPAAGSQRGPTVAVSTGAVSTPAKRRKRPWTSVAAGAAAVVTAIAVALFWWQGAGEEPSPVVAAAERAKEEADGARRAADAAGAAAERAREAAGQAEDESGKARDAATGGSCSLASSSAGSSRTAAANAEQEAATAGNEAGNAETAATAAEEAEAEARASVGAKEARRAPSPALAVLAVTGAWAADDASDDEASKALDEATAAAERARAAAVEARSAADAAAADANAARRSAEEAQGAAASCGVQPPSPPTPPPPTPPPGTVPPGTIPPGATPPPGTTPPSTPRPPGPLPETPVVAVLAVGDPVIAAPVEAKMEERLLRGGFDVRDEHNSLELQDLLDRQGDDVAISDLLPLLVREGFHVVVLVKVEVGERREMRTYGQELSMTFARLRLNAHLLPARRALGRGWSERVEYTELSAEAKAGQAFLGATADLVAAIRSGWESFRQGGR